jgi:starvation-inducible DNA-binding protein
VLTLYLKTKNFHWHMSGPHFRDYHLLLDEHAQQLFAMIDEIAERARKIGGTTLRSIGHASRLRRIADNDADFVRPGYMLVELREDNMQLISFMRETHTLCGKNNDVATASLLENWIDEAERRVWFLFETSRGKRQIEASTLPRMDGAPQASRPVEDRSSFDNCIGSNTEVPRRDILIRRRPCQHVPARWEWTRPLNSGTRL